jgi:hypothetical protein
MDYPKRNYQSREALPTPRIKTENMAFSITVLA